MPNGENITIAELLTMRSGLYGYTNDPGFAATLDSDPAKVWTPEEVLAIGFRHPPEFPPGTAYDYSNTNHVHPAVTIPSRGATPAARIVGGDVGAALRFSPGRGPAVAPQG